jgi:hypothetical protein
VRVQAAAGSPTDFRLDGGAASGGRMYVLAATASGTTPGILIPPIVVPLNLDPVFDLSLQLANSSVFVNTAGFLDAAGLARARFAPPPGVLAPVLGLDFHFAFVLLAPIDFASNPVRLTVVP